MGNLKRKKLNIYSHPLLDFRRVQMTEVSLFKFWKALIDSFWDQFPEVIFILESFDSLLHFEIIER